MGPDLKITSSSSIWIISFPHPLCCERSLSSFSLALLLPWSFLFKYFFSLSSGFLQSCLRRSSILLDQLRCLGCTPLNLLDSFRGGFGSPSCRGDSLLRCHCGIFYYPTFLYLNRRVPNVLCRVPGCHCGFTNGYGISSIAPLSRTVFTPLTLCAVSRILLAASFTLFATLSTVISGVDAVLRFVI